MTKAGNNKESKQQQKSRVTTARRSNNKKGRVCKRRETSQGNSWLIEPVLVEAVN
jgi:hypothetical protein